jgi:hypothetical protein
MKKQGYEERQAERDEVYRKELLREKARLNMRVKTGMATPEEVAYHNELRDMAAAQEMSRRGLHDKRELGYVDDIDTAHDMAIIEHNLRFPAPAPIPAPAPVARGLQPRSLSRGERARRWIARGLLGAVALGGLVVGVKHSVDSDESNNPGVSLTAKGNASASRSAAELKQRQMERGYENQVVAQKFKLVEHKTHNDMGTPSGIAYHQLKGTGVKVTHAVMAEAERLILENNNWTLDQAHHLPIGQDVVGLTADQINNLRAGAVR